MAKSVEKDLSNTRTNAHWVARKPSRNPATQRAFETTRGYPTYYTAFVNAARAALRIHSRFSKKLEDGSRVSVSSTTKDDKLEKK